MDVEGKISYVYIEKKFWYIGEKKFFWVVLGSEKMKVLVFNVLCYSWFFEGILFQEKSFYLEEIKFVHIYMYF